MSIFQGWDETEDFRVESRGCGIYAIYQRSGAAYVYAGTACGESAAEALDLFLDTNDDDDDDDTDGDANDGVAS